MLDVIESTFEGPFVNKDIPWKTKNQGIVGVNEEPCLRLCEVKLQFSIGEVVRAGQVQVCRIPSRGIVDKVLQLSTVDAVPSRGYNDCYRDRFVNQALVPR